MGGSTMRGKKRSSILGQVWRSVFGGGEKMGSSPESGKVQDVFDFSDSMIEEYERFSTDKLKLIREAIDLILEARGQVCEVFGCEDGGHALGGEGEQSAGPISPCPPSKEKA
jgi:hypothetical protein